MEAEYLEPCPLNIIIQPLYHKSLEVGTSYRPGENTNRVQRYAIPPIIVASVFSWLATYICLL